MATPTESGDRVTADLVSFVPRLTLEWLRSSPELRFLEIDGSLAFIDISGFTAMSEKLSSLGKAGAEEVTDVMNATFAALLDVAYAEGGGLLKFGGDALLLLYEGEHHRGGQLAQHSRCARTLRAIGRPRTSAGAITLHMHAGIHTGTFQFFLVGESHRELLVTGPAGDADGRDGSGVGSRRDPPEPGSRRAARRRLARRGEGRAGCSSPRPRRGELEPRPDVEGVPLELAVPAPLRAQLLEVGPLEGEHRNAAIGFVRFAGVDDVIADRRRGSCGRGTRRPRPDDPDGRGRARRHVPRERHRPRRRTHRARRRCPADLRRRRGAPLAHAPSGRRRGPPLPVHVGASRGRVFTGQVGATFRRTYTVLGDTAALAARLMARAGEDEIWVAADAFARAARTSKARSSSPSSSRGRASPCTQSRSEASQRRPPSDTTPDAPKLPFVDRERERAVLGASVAPVRMGFGTFVELVGEPGIGKSRLADELRDNCADMQLLTARCDQYESATPYHAFRPFLRSLLAVELNGGGGHNRAVLAQRLDAIDPDLVPWAPLLAAPLDVEVESTPEVEELDPSFRRARLHGLVGSLLGQLLTSPTLLVFEDVHWMDDASPSSSATSARNSPPSRG